MRIAVAEAEVRFSEIIRRAEAGEETERPRYGRARGAACRPPARAEAAADRLHEGADHLRPRPRRRKPSAASCRPFGRLLIVQAQIGNLTLLTADRRFRACDLRLL
jgi:antitoxin (DNA-binding transcriptional repressor) of toxin-antitoxin stability system